MNHLVKPAEKCELIHPKMLFECTIRSYVLIKAEKIRRELCDGCSVDDPDFFQPNQMGHLGAFGCLVKWSDLPEEIWERIVDDLDVTEFWILYTDIAKKCDLQSKSFEEYNFQTGDIRNVILEGWNSKTKSERYNDQLFECSLMMRSIW